MSDAALAGRWGGGVSPYEMSWQKLMMWIFLSSDALLFAGFLASYGFLRISAGDAWPASESVFHLNFIAAMTFVLITSSATMACAVSAAQKGDHGKLKMYLWATVLGGLGFLGMQAFEWSQVIGEGFRLDGYAGTTEALVGSAAAFPACFFATTGLHGSHVLSGIVILFITAVRSKPDRTSAAKVELAGLYWHFIDLVWVFIFGLFYLI